MPDQPNFGQKAMDYGLRLKLWIQGLFIVMTDLVFAEKLWITREYGLGGIWIRGEATVVIHVGKS